MSNDFTVGAALRAAAEALAARSESPQMEAQVLLSRLLDLDRARLLAYPERTLTPNQRSRYESLVRQRAGGVPLPYLTGRRAFYRHEFVVSPEVLIPRPETEHLVEAGLAWAGARAPHGEGLTLVDVGTGSGAIAVSLAAALPRATVHAIDISPTALAVACCNARRVGVTNVRFHQGHLLEALPAAAPLDLVAANLPYIPSAELESLAVARHEPRLALDGGPDGLALFRQLLRQAPARVAPSFCLLLEVGAGQGRAVQELCRAAFPGARIRVVRDYAGHDRVVEVSR